MPSKRIHRRKRNAPPRQARIDKIVNDYLSKLYEGLSREDGRVPGVAVAVRWNKKIVHLNCYGYANLETGARIKPETVFDLGSMSKQFTAAAAYNLMIHNQLDMKDRLSRFFKDLPDWADAITVEDLLHHTAASINPYHWLFVVGGLLMLVVLVPPAKAWAWLRQRAGGVR